ncbi:hypothetical protein YC2023_085128 [Brassica napus]
MKMFSVRLIFLILCIFFNGSLSKLERLDHPVTKSDGSLNILVVGDWGRQGGFNQSLVAHQQIVDPSYHPKKRKIPNTSRGK